MSKYSDELKLEVVRAYIASNGGYGSLAKKYGITNKSQVKQWVKIFKATGEEGLKKSKKNQKYSFDFKLSVVECYLEGTQQLKESKKIIKKYRYPKI